MFRVKVLWTINSTGGGFYIFDTKTLIVVRTIHYVLALTSLVSLNLLAPARTVTSLLMRQVVVTLLSNLCLGTRRLLCLPARALPGPAWPRSLSPSLAMIGALCKVIVYMIWSQCPVDGSLQLPIGPQTAQPAYSSSPLPRTGSPSPGSCCPDSGEGRWHFLPVSQCVQLPAEPATGELVPAKTQAPNQTWRAGSTGQAPDQPAYSSVICQSWSCQVIRDFAPILCYFQPILNAREKSFLTKSRRFSFV